jgi:hypothetical protein
MSFFDNIGLIMRFLPQLPTVERGLAAIRADQDIMRFIQNAIPVAQKALGNAQANPDIMALVQVGKDLFNALADQSGAQAVASALTRHGADPNQVQQAMASGNPDAYNGGSDNANI